MSENKFTPSKATSKAARINALKEFVGRRQALKSTPSLLIDTKEIPAASIVQGRVMYVPIKGTEAADKKIAVLKAPKKASPQKNKVNRREAQDFLVRAGVLDAKGNLRPVFRSSSEKL